MTTSHGKSLLLSLMPLIIALALNSACGPSRSGGSSPTLSPTTVDRRAWILDSKEDSIGIFVLDYETNALQRAYLADEEPCSDRTRNRPLDDETLLVRAGGFFEAVGNGWWRIQNESGADQLNLTLSRVGDLAITEIDPGDIGGFAVLHQCSGQLLFAGSIIWAGRGQQLFPAIPLDEAALRHTGQFAPAPGALDIVIGPGGAGDFGHDRKGREAWQAIRDLNLVRELAVDDYEVLVYLYPRSVGDFSPGAAYWVIFVSLGSVDPALWTPGAVTSTPSPTPTPYTMPTPDPAGVVTATPVSYPKPEPVSTPYP